MAKRSKSQLKAIFSRGKRPTETDFSDFIDSVVHLDDQSAVNAQVVNQAINAYNTNLLAKKPDGAVNSVGDVYGAFEGMNDALKLVDLIKWSGLPGKPADTVVEWTEQLIVTDRTKFDPQPTATPGPGYTSQNPDRFTIAGLGVVTGRFLVSDITVERRWISIPTGGSPVTFYVDQIVAVKLAITPKAKLA